MKWKNYSSLRMKVNEKENYENGANFAKLSFDFGMHDLTIRAIV